MVKDYSDGKRRNPLLSLHRLLIPINNKGSFTVHDSTYHGVGYIRWMEKNTTMEGKEGNILFNDALNTFYLRLYDIRHMVKDHSDSKS